jgi:hypothetical protein
MHCCDSGTWQRQRLLPFLPIRQSVDLTLRKSIAVAGINMASLIGRVLPELSGTLMQKQPTT